MPAGRVELIARVLIGIAIGSAAGMICAAVAIWRHERPWWLWLIGILLNAYPFIFFLLGLAVLLGITRIHL